MTSISPVGRSAFWLPSGRAGHGAGDLQAVLRAQVVGHRLVADDDLDDAGGVAQVDEGDPAVVAAAGDPAGEGDGLSDVLGAEAACVMGADHESFSLMVCSSWSSGTATWSPVVMVLSWASPASISRSPEHDGEPRPGPVGALHRALEPAAAVRHVHADPGAPQPGGDQDRPAARRRHRAVRRTRRPGRGRPPRAPRPGRPAGCGRRRGRSRCRTAAARRAPPSARRSGRRRRCPTGRRARRGRTRTWCGCSSRGRAPSAALIDVRRPRGRRAASRTSAKWAAQSSHRWSSISGASSSCARTFSRLSSRTRSGLIRARSWVASSRSSVPQERVQLLAVDRAGTSAQPSEVSSSR